jgi:hypothetical protein
MWWWAFSPANVPWHDCGMAWMAWPLRIASIAPPKPTFGRVMQLIDRQLGSRGVYHRIVCVSRSVMESFAAYPETYRAACRW